MRRVLIAIAAAVALSTGTAVPALAATHTARSGAPTASQIRKAIAAATRSSYLWATVNVCSSKSGGLGGLMGVRGEMPALNFGSTLSMTIQLRQFSTSTGKWSPLTGKTATQTISLGAYSSHVHQGGAEFPFTADPGKLDALVTFVWTRAGKRLGETQVATTAGHPAAAYSQPLHYSAATCTFS